MPWVKKYFSEKGVQLLFLKKIDSETIIMGFGSLFSFLRVKNTVFKPNSKLYIEKSIFKIFLQKFQNFTFQADF